MNNTSLRALFSVMYIACALPTFAAEGRLEVRAANGALREFRGVRFAMNQPAAEIDRGFLAVSNEKSFPNMWLASYLASPNGGQLAAIRLIDSKVLLTDLSYDHRNRGHQDQILVIDATHLKSPFWMGGIDDLQAILSAEDLGPDFFDRMRPVPRSDVEALSSLDQAHRLAETSTNPAESMFTDYGYDAVALPRNHDLPGNRSAASFDLGLCERKNAQTPTNDEKWCSNFRTPSLRNVAVRDSFGHNGVYKKLRDVVAFYALRAVAPARIYPPGQKFDDVPAKYRGNVNIYAPVYNRREGAPPPMTDDEIDAVVAFLGTLTDAPYVRPRCRRRRRVGGGLVAQSPAR